MDKFVPPEAFASPLELADFDPRPDPFELAVFFSQFMCSVAAHAGTWPGFPIWRPNSSAHGARSDCSHFCPAPPFYDEMVEVVGWGSDASAMLNQAWMTDWFSIAGPTVELQLRALQGAMEAVASIGTLRGNEHLCCAEYLATSGIGDDAFLSASLRVVVLDPEVGRDVVQGTYPYWVLRTAHELLLARRLLGVLNPNVTRWYPTPLT